MTEAYAYFGTSDVRLSCLPAKWGKDYLTGGTPEPQIGSDAVQIPLIEGTYFTPTGGQDINEADAPRQLVLQAGGPRSRRRTNRRKWRFKGRWPECRYKHSRNCRNDYRTR